MSLIIDSEAKYIEFLTGDSTEGEELGRYCNYASQLFPVVSSNTVEPSQLTLIFRSDVDVQYSGFVAQFYVCKLQNLREEKLQKLHENERNWTQKGECIS